MEPSALALATSREDVRRAEASSVTALSSPFVDPDRSMDEAEVQAGQLVNAQEGAPERPGDNVEDTPDKDALASSHHQASTSMLGLQPDNQALMHLLSLVGSRFLEAEGSGIVTAGGDEDGSGEGSEEEGRLDAGRKDDNARRIAASTSALYPEPIADARMTRSQQFDERGRSAASSVGVHRRLLFGQAIDDQATPKGSSTPLGASLLRGARPETSTEHTLYHEHAPAISPLAAANPFRRGVENESGASSASSTSTSATTDANISIHALSIHALEAHDAQDDADNAPDDEARNQDTLASSAGELARTSAQDSLAARLQAVFELEEMEPVISCHPCWLFRGILLQGYLYLLQSHVLFYAYLPSRQENVLKAGTLRKKTRRTHRFTRHWFVLRGRSLSWYESETDPFFPQDHIDLRNVLEVTSCETDETFFEVRTPYRKFCFDAGASSSRDAWINTLRRAVFRAQNEGESVRICIPLETIVDVENNATALAGLSAIATSSAASTRSEQAHDMINIKVLQTLPGDVDGTLEDYLFVRVEKSTAFRDALCARLQQAASPKGLNRQLGRKTSIRDSTQTRSAHQPIAIPKRAPTAPQRSPSGQAEERLEGELADASSTAMDVLSTSARTLKTSELAASSTGYPPSPSALGNRLSLSAERANPLASLLQSATAHTTAFAERLPRRLVRENWSRPEPSKSRERSSSGAPSDSDGSSSFSVLDNQESDPADHGAIADFHITFSLPDDEELLGHVKASLYRVLPVSGRLYISTHYICFRSSRFPTKAMGRTLMVMPRSEIVSVRRNNAFQYGSQGLVVIVRGHEEVFFEFASVQRRDQCIALLKFNADAQNTSGHDATSEHARLLLTDMADLNVQDDARVSQTAMSPNPLSPSISGSSSFLPQKPRPHLHFTFLTVGSRGDVQPYIALAQGLQKDGHRVRIATHPEFQDWIQGFGFEFRGVGGDPAELMRICVENGTFTVAFVREGVTKFRGWLDDLLLSCWRACQGTDVVIESPSAIAGIHVAEALQVPYFRAFTMPWSRTRAYPHAFAVPARHAGGNYNYMSYVIFDQVFWRASAGQINAWRRKVLRLKPTSLDRLEAHKVPFLYNFSPSLVPKPLDWYDWIHVTGYWFLDRDDSAWTPPQDLVDFIATSRARGKNLVYIGWGSIVVADADAVLRIVLEAVRQSGVHAIISRGWSDRLSEKSTAGAEQYQDSVFMVDSVPHGWLFPQVDVACHHGGSGTLGASLRAGVPTIVRPYFGDQFFWASQIENLHVGKRLSSPFTSEEFAAALTHCCRDEQMRRNASALGSRIADENGVEVAIRAIYADWHYALSRIRTDTRLDEARATNAAGTMSVIDAGTAGDDNDDANSLDDGWSVVSGSESDAPSS